MYSPGQPCAIELVVYLFNKTRTQREKLLSVCLAWQLSIIGITMLNYYLMDFVQRSGEHLLDSNSPGTGIVTTNTT